MKIIKHLQDLVSGLVIKFASETIKNEQKGGFLSMLLRTLGASLLGNLLTDQGATATSPEQGTIRAGEGTLRAGQGFNVASPFNKFSNTKVSSKRT